MTVVGKWVDLENTILSKVIQIREEKLMFSLIGGRRGEREEGGGALNSPSTDAAKLAAHTHALSWAVRLSSPPLTHAVSLPHHRR